MNDPAAFAVRKPCGCIDDHDPHRWHGVRPIRRAYWCVGEVVVESSNAEKRTA